MKYCHSVPSIQNQDKINALALLRITIIGHGYRTLRQRTVRQNFPNRWTVRRNFSKRVDGTAESYDTHNTDNMDGAAELKTVSVINEGK